MRNICVIGGSRYFGKHLIERLLADGAHVTLVNRGSEPAPPGVEHLLADRDDETALVAALGDRTFDAVIDQVCYTPVQAAIAARAFDGRTGRYVMTSTIEVYDTLDADEPVTEIDPATWPVTSATSWGYGEGKRQAEAVLAGSGLAFASVRSTHVLGGQDFTGRLQHYVDAIRENREIVVHPAPRRTVFINDREIADVLFWAAGETFTGPVNACSHGEFDVFELCALLGGEPRFTVGDADVSPYSFDRYYAMSNERATKLGFTFSRTADWLPELVA
ncbi:NAD-dependent epimerase/dehydratase family protein [Nonomuraea sp. NPDC050556]|uniref:NAD-dependent epimerase/dehydratase family protein n=1 Tax=Nonomuraea sp. NPDC050556 TaxID=3364369 RepID=UPI00379BD43D